MMTAEIIRTTLIKEVDIQSRRKDTFMFRDQKEKRLKLK